MCGANMRACKDLSVAICQFGAMLLFGYAAVLLYENVTKFIRLCARMLVCPYANMLV